ncbi:hypothetical protein [Sutcliffiella horikoshii]|uniref:hypothetical protein n=1 Tax=Sutcliffiella horikoshii TaxID=79883 RepID=UPI001F247691|nr:hypothetical protein [Sutcliffiella horikoshii]MCG1023167.1 hypothetical protein [Sutcliffiella horikoshii]
MITKQLHIFIQYPIKETVTKQYEATMEQVLKVMHGIGANEFQWSKASEEKGAAYYRESFLLPTESHYFAMKALRCSPENHVFHELSQYIDTEAGPVQYVGLKITS